MNIAVLIKQVPATDKVKMDEKTGTMVRGEMEAELNPLDMYAVEEAVRTKERLARLHPSEETVITAISMGPPAASDAIRDAIAPGCDRGVLLSDRAFAGSDTFATALILSEAIKNMGKFDIIFTGERATDGETGQVGPSVAAQLNIPALTYVSKISEIDEKYITVERAVEEGREVIRAEMPVLISVTKEINEPRLPNLAGKIRAKKSSIEVFNAEALNLPEERTGLKGSPTRVVKVFYPQIRRNGTIVSGKDPERAADALVKFLKKRGII